MEERICETCASFVQHYRKSVHNGETRYYAIGCGHCLKRRPKRYPSETPACELWRSGGGGVTK